MKDFIFSNNNFSKWYQTILWWELYRILYNLIMMPFGIVSVAIASITIPIFYIFIGLGLNVCYSLLSIIELVDKKDLLKDGTIKNFRKKNFIIYSVLSIFCIFLVPTLILFLA